MVRWIRNIAILGLLCGFLLPAIGFVIGAVRGLDGVSQTEKRVLATLPTFNGAARAYTTEFDSFLEDNFGLRMLMIRTARKIRDNLGEDPPAVVVGKDGWLFLGSNAYRDEFEGNGRWNDDDVETWVNSLSEMKAVLNGKNIPFAAFVAIDKARAYPEYLPNDWDVGVRRFRTALYNHPDANQTGLVDAEAYVFAAKSRGEQVFYLGDTHWTSAGTYDLASALMDQLDPVSQRPRYVAGPATDQPGERLLDLEGMAGRVSTQEPTHRMITFPTARAGFRTSITLFEDGTPDPGQFSTLRILGTADAPAGTLVIVGDSFGDSMVGHFWPSYAQIIRIHHGAQFKNITLDEVLSYNPDAVLFATAERQAARKDRPFAPLGTP